MMRHLFSKIRSRRGFTLLEVVISMGILALLAGAVYAVVSASISASQSAMAQQLTLRRIDAFLRVTREAFLNLPADSTVTLEIGRSKNGSAEPWLVLTKPQQVFGIPSLAGGSLVLAARPRPDGTRTITLLTIPPNATDRERTEALAAPGTPLLPHLRKPRWTFKTTAQDEEWREELPAGSPKPLLVRLQFEVDELPNPVEAVFYLPPVATAPPNGTDTNSPSSDANPTPSPKPGS